MASNATTHPGKPTPGTLKKNGSFGYNYSPHFLNSRHLPWCLHFTKNPSLLHSSAKLAMAVQRHSQSPPLSHLFKENLFISEIAKCLSSRAPGSQS